MFLSGVHHKCIFELSVPRLWLPSLPVLQVNKYIWIITTSKYQQYLWYKFQYILSSKQCLRVIVMMLSMMITICGWGWWQRWRWPSWSLPSFWWWQRMIIAIIKRCWWSVCYRLPPDHDHDHDHDKKVDNADDQCVTDCPLRSASCPPPSTPCVRSFLKVTSYTMISMIMTIMMMMMMMIKRRRGGGR